MAKAKSDILIKHAEGDWQAEIKALADDNGGELTAAAIVKQASKQASSLHKFFEWGNDAAAHQYRLIQAAGLIRRYEVIIVNLKSEDESRVRGFVSLQTGENANERKWVVLDKVVVSKDRTDEMLEMAARDLSAYRKKYSSLKELSDVFAVIDEWISERESVAATT